MPTEPLTGTEITSIIRGKIKQFSVERIKRSQNIHKNENILISKQNSKYYNGSKKKKGR